MFSISKHIRLPLLNRPSSTPFRIRIVSPNSTRFTSQNSKSNFNNDHHSADHYFKDVDNNPPADPTIHRVDAGSESVQRPHEPPSGPWSQAGVKSEEYRRTDRDEVPAGDKMAKMDYGVGGKVDGSGHHNKDASGKK